jgi:uroporphyrinogen decarboxylase
MVRIEKSDTCFFLVTLFVVAILIYFHYYYISYANGELSKLGYDVVTMDGSVSRDTARDAVEGRAGLQGNYDPRELIDDGHHTSETVRQTARQLLVELGPQRLIANLGEGLGGNESTALVEAFVDSIHQESKEMISSQKK